MYLECCVTLVKLNIPYELKIITGIVCLSAYLEQMCIFQVNQHDFVLEKVHTEVRDSFNSGTEGFSPVTGSVLQMLSVND